MTPRRYLVLATVAITAPLGDMLLAKGMRQVGPVSLSHLGALIHAIATPYIALGIAMLIGFFSSYLTALSWADLTYVLPTTSIGNVVIALLSRFWLHEQITPSRWLGIVLITMGVGFVANGDSYTETCPTGVNRLGKDDLHAPSSAEMAAHAIATGRHEAPHA